MPLHNSALYMSQAIESVIGQTYDDWELVLVDDGSTDSSFHVAETFVKRDPRVKLHQHKRNLGAAAARNTALAAARGRFISYLDSDDFWHRRKLERQAHFSKINNYAVTIVSYATVEADGELRNLVNVPRRTNRHQFLVRPPTCTHTIMVDTRYVPKETLRMPLLTRRQDAATWLQVLNTGQAFYGLDEILAFNRKRPNSLSANKIAAAKATWHLYRTVERLNSLYATYCLLRQLANAIGKRRRQYRVEKKLQVTDTSGIRT